MSPRCSTRAGFSVRELVLVMLLVFGLLGLGGLLVQGVQKVHESADRTQTNNNLKQVSLSCHGINDTYKRLPPAFDAFGSIRFATSVHIHLVPYCESSTFYKEFREAQGQGDAANERVPYLLSPQDWTTGFQTQPGISNLAANLRVFSTKGIETKFNEDMKLLAEIEPGKAAIPADFLDGTSNTISFVCKYGHCGTGGSRYVSSPIDATAPFFGQNAATTFADPSAATATYQLSPTQEECRTSPLMAQSFTTAGLSVGLFDGSVRMVSPNISPQTWNQAVQPNDGLKFGDDWD